MTFDPATLDDPINRIEWVPASTLRANGWNPNVVMTNELRLLELSILSAGWIQPIMISRDNLVIDGFHRWSLSKDSEALQARYQGLVPAARVDVGEAEAMLLTVRMNRAKGTHIAIRMSELVRTLVDEHKMPIREVAKGIGASKAEAELLYQENIFQARDLANAPYSRAWIPE